MRYTLSVLTAVCLLALGQPAWSNHADGEWLQRVRLAASSLPATDRASAALLWHALQAQALSAVPQRPLPLGRTLLAAQQVLAQHYGSTLQAHLLPQPVVATHWYQAVAIDLQACPRMLLDSAMVQRWANALQMASIDAFEQNCDPAHTEKHQPLSMPHPSSMVVTGMRSAIA